MLSTLRIASLRATPILARTVVVAPTIARATVARFSTNIDGGRFRFKSAPAFAVDAPDGIHDDQDIEESHDWANRTVTMAAATEDAAAINEMHDAAKREALFAVDAPDGEHDGEDVEEHMSGVNNIIDDASLFEEPDEIRVQQHMRDQTFLELNKISEHDV